MAVQSWQPHDVKVAGNVSAHYQPMARLHLFSTTYICDKLNTKPELNIGVVSYSKSLNKQLAALPEHHHVSLPADKQGYARMLYAALYQLDKSGVDTIWLEQPPTTDEWLDVNDRLSRATHQ